jgi:hypothetical protein
MPLALATLFAAASIGVDLDGGYSPTLPARLLASPASYPARVADDAHRPGFNGRVFRTRPIVGPGHGPYLRDEPGPGAGAYGAWGQEGRLIFVRHNHQVLAIRAFERIGVEPLERSRQAWLRREGYVGGVRTFVTDAPRGTGGQASGLPQPRGIIELSPDAPRQRARPMVDARPGERPVIRRWTPRPAELAAAK